MLFDRRAWLVNFCPILVCLLGFPSGIEAQTPAMVEFFAAGRLQKGLLLVDLTHETVVMGRDGWLHSLDPREPESRLRSINEVYNALGFSELRNELQSEFGKDFEVVATGNYLVVQPTGRGNRWPQLFEQSHRAFHQYMKKRGVEIRQGRFPMVAIVFPDESAMYREFRRLEIDVTRVAGLYSGDSNRVMTHDGGQSSQIAATVRHEAAHQSAFNSGIHSRINDTPRWITEGVGQMFEPVAMTDQRSGARLVDRVNQECRYYLDANFDATRDGEFSKVVMQLVSDDSMFDDPKTIDDAYAVAWAMMFYLAERDPQAFAEILNHTANRPPFQLYSRTDRIHDFERIAGSDPFEFSQNLKRFIQGL